MNSRSALDKVQGKRTFIFCLFGVTLSSADQALFAFAIPGIMEEFGVGLGIISVLLTASFALAAIIIVPIGLLADRIGRRWLFAILLGASAFCAGAQSMAESFWTLSALRIVSFAIAAGLYPLANTLVIEAAEERSQGMLSGLLQIGYPLGFFLGSLVAAPLIALYGWRGIFMPAFLVVPAAALIGAFLRETAAIPRGKAQEHHRFIEPLIQLSGTGHRRTALFCFGGSFFISLAIGAFTYFIPTFLSEARGADLGSATRITGIAYAIGGAGYVIAALLGEYLLTRRLTLVLWCWLAALILAAAVLVPSSPQILMLFLGLTVIFLFGSEAVRMPLIGESFPTSVRATATSFSGSFGVTTAWLTAPLIVAVSVPTVGWEYTFVIVGSLPLTVAGLLFLQLPRRPPELNLQPIRRFSPDDC